MAGLGVMAIIAIISLWQLKGVRQDAKAHDTVCNLTTTEAKDLVFRWIADGTLTAIPRQTGDLIPLSDLPPESKELLSYYSSLYFEEWPDYDFLNIELRHNDNGGAEYRNIGDSEESILRFTGEVVLLSDRYVRDANEIVIPSIYHHIVLVGRSVMDQPFSSM